VTPRQAPAAVLRAVDGLPGHQDVAGTTRMAFRPPRRIIQDERNGKPTAFRPGPEAG